MTGCHYLVMRLAVCNNTEQTCIVVFQHIHGERSNPLARLLVRGPQLWPLSNTYIIASHALVLQLINLQCMCLKICAWLVRNMSSNRYSGINMGIFNFLFYHLFEGISLKKNYLILHCEDIQIEQQSFSIRFIHSPSSFTQ